MRASASCSKAVESLESRRFLSATGSISGRVFSDNNRDGLFNSGDTLLANRKIYLDMNKDGKFESGEPFAMSNASGAYSFTGLSQALYDVRRADVPAGYFLTSPKSGVWGVTIVPGLNVTGMDFGAASGSMPSGGATISGRVFSDANKNGVFDSGDTLLANRKIYIDLNNDGKFESNEPSALSNANGVYTFSGLALGQYTVRRADLPAGYNLTLPSSGAWFGVDLVSGAHITGIDFGAAQGTVIHGTSSISGTVFNDANKNGKLDSGESLLANRKIYIDVNDDGKLDAGDISTFSNAQGVYTFNELGAGTFIVRRADTPTGYKITDPASGLYDITLTVGQTVTGKDIGAALI